MASHNSSDLDVTTILAALRLHRRKPQCGTARRPGTGHGLGTNARRQTCVAAPGLDELCTCLYRSEAHDGRRFLVVPADLVPTAPVSGAAAHEVAELDVMAAALEFAEERDGLPGIQVTHNTGAGSVWVCAEECGDVEYTASLVQALLRRFELDLVVGFEWANTCSRPRLDGFGGGAVAVSRRSAVWFSTDALLEKAVRAETERLKLKSGDGLHDVDLDSAVMAIASALAADVNSRDAEAQLDFPNKHGWKSPTPLLRKAEP